jgi:hypothetical protein
VGERGRRQGDHRINEVRPASWGKELVSTSQQRSKAAIKSWLGQEYISG